MVRYSDDVLEAVRRSVDVAEVVGRYVPLKRAGKSWKGCCPFHQEKTPSFHVHPESGIWKCYGCQKGGNVFGFLIEREAMTFPEAVRQLAREGGIALPDDEDPQAAAKARRLELLRGVVEWACKAFEAALKSSEGDRAKDYFKRRGITGATAKAFRLGYALPGWDGLLTAARGEGIPETDLLDAGLVIEREGGGFYDRFRDRVVFPIQDSQGRVIAFGARTLGDDEPKYLNSPETPLFTKGRHLYALHAAKQEMLRAPHEGAVMEGYTDVILAHQAGFKVAVAGLGTALTAEQAKKLAQYVKKLYLVYDGDSAGQRAAEKAIAAFLPEPIETRVCVLPGGKDPAELIVEDGVDAFRACLAASKEAFEHLLGVRAKAHEESGIPGRAAAADECLAALAGVRDEVRRALYLKRLADAYGIPEEVLGRKLRPAEREQATRRASPVADAQRREGGSLPQRVPEFVSETPDAPPEPPDTPPSPTERLLLQSLLARPELLREAPDDLAASFGSRLVRRLVARIAEEAEGDTFDVARVIGSLEPALAALAADVRMGASGGRSGTPEGDELLRQGRECMQFLVLAARLREAEDRRRAAEADDDLALLDQALRDIVAHRMALQRMQPPRAQAPRAKR